VNVVGYDESLGTKTYVTMSGVVAYAHERGGHSTWLFIRQFTFHTLTTTYFALCNVA